MDLRSDRTVIIPTPGGRLPPDTEAAYVGDDGRWKGLFDDAEKFVSSGFNRLENAAFTILALIPAIKTSPTNPSFSLLRQQILEEVTRYENAARKSGVDSKTTMVGRYVLCTVLDEMVLNTPWGAQGDWRKHSLLSYFHQETCGGENFFVMLENLEKDPSTNIDLLELMYVCLVLGFEGRYAVEHDRIGKLSEVRGRLYRVIKTQRGETARQLSPNWRGVAIASQTLRQFIPLWAYCAILLGLVALLFFAFTYSINQISEPPYQALASLGSNVGTNFELQPIPDISSLEKLRTFLKAEIAKNLVAVTERDGLVRIIIQGDRLFKSGSAKLNSEHNSLIHRIAAALYEVEGKVNVEGHTDSRPINTLRFPSNWHLSLARAEEVEEMLSQSSKEFDRYEAVGKGDTESVADNKVSSGRARNRRVEIVLLSNLIWRATAGNM